MPMLKNTTFHQYELEMINLEWLASQYYLIRKVAKTIDFEFICNEVAHLYCQDNARPVITSYVHNTLKIKKPKDRLSDLEKCKKKR